MHTDPMVSMFVITMLISLLIALILKKLKQPYIIGYLLVGVLLGPFGLKIIHDQDVLSRIGNIGVVLLLFFSGMEISIHRSLRYWIIPIVGTLFQVFFTLAIVFGIGYFRHWSLNLMILASFIISLSSTAVVLKLLQDWGELQTHIGRCVLGILVIQDLAVVPMMVVLGILSRHHVNIHELSLQIIGSLLMLLIAGYVIVKKRLSLPFIKWIKEDGEMQVLTSLLICFGMATLTSLFNLSSALGAFIAGMIIASAKETEWVHHSLSSMKVIFMALFFISIGMLINLHFMVDHIKGILIMLAVTYVMNTFVNIVSLRLFSVPKPLAIYGAALLSQLGEFGFVLVSIGYQTKVIDDFGYHLMITVIALSLLFSPLWIIIVKKLTNVSAHQSKIKMMG